MQLSGGEPPLPPKRSGRKQLPKAGPSQVPKAGPSQSSQSNTKRTSNRRRTAKSTPAKPSAAPKHRAPARSKEHVPSDSDISPIESDESGEDEEQPIAVDRKKMRKEMEVYLMSMPVLTATRVELELDVPPTHDVNDYQVSAFLIAVHMSLT